MNMPCDCNCAGDGHHKWCASLAKAALMSDFKVGDVVRFKSAKVPGKVVSISGPAQVDVHIAGIAYYNMDPADLSLVSRPSDPPKEGDWVEHRNDPLLRGQVDWVRGDGLVRIGTEASGYRHAMMADLVKVDPPKPKPSAPALKVGDRVRVTMGNMRSSIGVVDSISGESVDVCLETGGLFLTCAKALEPLPPEPAKARCNRGDPHPVSACGDLAGCLRNGITAKPMTATEAIIAQRHQEGAGQIIESLYEKALRGAAEKLAEKVANPCVEGWMPAGTYMPLKGEPKRDLESMLAAKLIDRAARRLLFRPLDRKLDPTEKGPGISASIPHRDRRFPSRTLTWGNLGDDYDLLPDAE